MNLSSHNSTSSGAPRTDAGSAEATLRMIAQLPAPRGLEDRVIAGLESAPRRGRLLEWPAILRPGSSWMRGAAAAAIVFVVAGGGWGIYTHVLPTQPANVVVMPRAGAGGGFSSAGAMRTPQTLDGPVVAEPAKQQGGVVKADDGQPAQASPMKKAPAKVVPMAKAKANAAGKLVAEPTVSAVQ